MKKVHNSTLLAQTDNITRVIEKVHIAASRFSKSTAALKGQIGCMLFTHKDNNISLNKAGQKLHQKPFPVYQRLSTIDNEIHNSGCHSREVMIGIDNIYPTVIFDQLINLGDKYGGVIAQPAGFSGSGVIGNLFGRQLDFSISSQHVSARVWELKNPTIDGLPSLRLDFLISRRHEERRGLLQELPWLRVRFRNRTNFEVMIDTNMCPYGVDPTVIYCPYSFAVRISAVERKHFLAVIPYLAWRLANPTTPKHSDVSYRLMYMQERLYPIRDHRYVITMLQHVTENRDGTNH